MPLTSFGQQKLGDIALGKTDWTMPTDLALGIFTASPGENGSLVSEFTGGLYTRKLLTPLMGVANANGIATNTSAITFPANTAAHGTTLYGGIIDVSTLGLGNMIFYAPWANPKVINNGDPAVVVPVGALTVGIAGSEEIMISSYLMKKLVDHALGKASYSKPSIYHGLLTSNPTIAGIISSEVGVGNYARQPLTAAMNAIDATAGTSSNATAITYPDPAADYPTVNYTFAADAVSAGNLLFADMHPSAIDIRNGAAPVLFPAGTIRFTVA